MVKGVSRQVVVVSAPDEKLFEQAIFLVRSDISEEGVTARALVQEARRITKDCAVGHTRKFKPSLSPQFSAFLGASVVGLAWILVTLFT